MTTPDGEVVFEYDRCRFTMKFDMKAIAFFEREADCSILVPLRDVAAAQEDPNAPPPKMSHIAMLVQAGLRAHHPEISLDKAMRMAGDPEVQKALGTAQQASQPRAAPGETAPDASAGGNVANSARPKKAGRGTTTSGKRSKPG